MVLLGVIGSAVLIVAAVDLVALDASDRRRLGVLLPDHLPHDRRRRVYLGDLRQPLRLPADGGADVACGGGGGVVCGTRRSACGWSASRAGLIVLAAAAAGGLRRDYAPAASELARQPDNPVRRVAARPALPTGASQSGVGTPSGGGDLDGAVTHYRAALEIDRSPRSRSSALRPCSRSRANWTPLCRSIGVLYGSRRTARKSTTASAACWHSSAAIPRPSPSSTSVGGCFPRTPRRTSTWRSCSCGSLEPCLASGSSSTLGEAVRPRSGEHRIPLRASRFPGHPRPARRGRCPVSTGFAHRSRQPDRARRTATHQREPDVTPLKLRPR